MKTLRSEGWLAEHDYPDLNRYRDQALAIFGEVALGRDVREAIHRHPKPEGGMLSKDYLVQAYRHLADSGDLSFDPELLRRLRMKPVRTLSGVTTVTVLTKPYPCPGKCIFCPTDVRMPKSYLHDEPGAIRAEFHAFDPHDQCASRIRALQNVGHNTAKIELLVLGGTWSAYRRDYQAWFIRRCLDAINGRDSASLAEAQRWNETAAQRNVGLVIETRPDHVDAEEIAHLRLLGVTKVQLGAQSLDDRVLEANRRGHDVECTRRAVRLLRAAGFKILLHWMPNLLGATPEGDRDDFLRLWSDPDLRPDELKIYPCSLLANAELYDYWRRGEYRPYTQAELLELLVGIKPRIPRYCRVNRVIRDIPSTNVVEGNRRSNLREDVHAELKRRGLRCECIRCREVRAAAVGPDQLTFDDLAYTAGAAEEHFLSFNTPDDRLAGYLRLSLPGPESPATNLRDLDGAALIREVHVYGPAVEVGAALAGAAQHTGLGTRLLQRAEAIARECGYPRMAVIASVGTREYYRARGYEAGETYMVRGVEGGG